ncbi:MAG: hypothetical protein IJX53_00780 [Clostridia bacterium]|nr:hypothetical protein [Clostridia bacterium]
MKYIFRIFYDLTTGEIIFFYTQTGEAINIMPLSHDFAVYPQLADRTEADTGCLEWLERDEDLETKLTSGEYIATVDVTQTPHALVFTEPPVDPNPTLTADEALAIITGEAE